MRVRTGVGALTLCAVLGTATAWGAVSGTGLAAASTPFVAGTSSASAQVLSVPVALAGENVGVTGALSNAGYTNIDGQSETELVSSGLIGELPIPAPPQLAPLEASSTSSLVSTSKTVAGSVGTGVGNEAVAASESSGLASVSFGGLTAGSTVVISGGQSVAGGSIVDGTTRQATSSASVGSLSLLDGLVVLDGLEWTALQRTGSEVTASSSFSIASVKVAGVNLPVTAPSEAATFAAINTALATTGIHLSAPRQVIGANGSVTESPLSIGLDNSALGAEVLGPVVSAVQPLRNVLFNDLASLSTSTGEVDLVAEIVLGILAGQGSLDLNLGGAYAQTDGTAYVDPFGSAGGSGVAGDAGSTLGSASVIPETGSGIFAGAGSSIGPTGPGPSGAAVATTTTTTPGLLKRAATRLTSSTSCQSSTVGSCQPESAKTVAIILVAGTALLALAELVRQRRKLRRLAAAAVASAPDGPSQ